VVAIEARMNVRRTKRGVRASIAHALCARELYMREFSSA
jgi:hypothetical protein